MKVNTAAISVLVGGIVILALSLLGYLLGKGEFLPLLFGAIGLAFVVVGIVLFLRKA